MNKILCAKEHVCQECGKPFKPTWEYRGLKFCSKKCQIRNHNKKYLPQKYRKERTIVCDWCGKEVTIKPDDRNRRKYCSDQCARQAAVKSRWNRIGKEPPEVSQEAVTANCRMCGKTFVIPPGTTLPLPECCCRTCKDFYERYKKAKNKKLIFQRFLDATDDNTPQRP